MGLYAQARAGRLSGLTGIDDPYEPPQSPDAKVETQLQSVGESVDVVHALMTERGLL
jgi:adenylylsulfate kinase